jgi:hypothetical protein
MKHDINVRILIRHGGKHDIYQNLDTGISQPIPRHYDKFLGSSLDEIKMKKAIAPELRHQIVDNYVKN